ncbi:heat shock transcription factor, X-linked-like [Uloborus diversus]|uniref:heat shock transcription factor, X-linked-like n=1 Tax=Uloborus diversus TaxID=327109 RepID=UPI002409234C|nr:heat shock transcription factor, X-linked-like [Uloborus diversus]
MYQRSLMKPQNMSNIPPLRFPQKLYKIANECQSGAVSWSPDGKSVLLRYSLFKDEFMSIKSDFFKTDNISSFVRQLNLYGFRKVYDHAHKHAYRANPDLHEFSNSYFQRDRPDLLDKVVRKSGILKDRNDYLLDGPRSPGYIPSFFDEDLTDEIASKENIYPYENVEETVQKPRLIKSIFIDEPEEKKVEPPKLVEEISKENKCSSVSPVEPLPEENAPREEAAATSVVLVPPPKKKRGRKPGTKSDPNKIRTARKIKLGFIGRSKQRRHRCPTLKNPERYQNLIYSYEDDSPSVFLRHTSPDIMLSSTLPFQESPEYLELKEAFLRMHGQEICARYTPSCLNIHRLSLYPRAGT